MTYLIFAILATFLICSPSFREKCIVVVFWIAGALVGTVFVGVFMWIVWFLIGLLVLALIR